ncbi:MAG TPA: hypothetical protein V6C72_01500, partial [Chroococcales cyanobacterium]
WPLAQKMPDAVALSACLVLSQIANAAGFFVQSLRGVPLFSRRDDDAAGALVVSCYDCQTGEEVSFLRDPHNPWQLASTENSTVMTAPV